ncbi:alpha/beta hydrolase [Leptospira gomenensis]|uniref:Alpha/beta hydrolase n=1 Tax=Leptospira gomenensis TaxID=2484974 RepID=A0A5F1YIH3_9LEPT|nr:alpha/beta hydrolase [Leptospira gomenensis]TGK37518.1 alpha/beta hydrolase [Leptospira gomenensis]TGK39476.1 alpha/beta hydrolase [Leptospira gomenensis]TGK43102.1 alpha/beta hydrolase [Leptospira gomenensis]TGK55069.1 alpha/beta hydrolase [Leptospira gomenensis]
MKFELSSFRSRPSFGKVFLFTASVVFFFSSCTNTLIQSGLAWEHYRSDLETKTVVADGYRWKYLEGGKGETILLIHGFGGDKDNWTRFVRTLTDSYHVISPDLPGFGENDRKPEDEYSVSAQVLRLHGFASVLGLKRFHLIGNSMGGFIAGMYSILYPDQVVTLALVDTAGVNSPIPSELSGYLSRGKNPLVVENEKDFEFLMNFIFVKPPYIPFFLKTYFSERAIRSREFNEKIYREIRTEFGSLQEKMSSIRARTLILWGDSDRVIHVSSSEVLHKGISGSVRVILKDCGHSPQLERPKESAEVYRNFLTGNLRRFEL